MRRGEAEFVMASRALFSLYVKNISTATRCEQLAVSVKDTSVLATSHKLSLLVHYPETYLRGFGTLGKRRGTAIRIAKGIPLHFGVMAKHT
jgi:hypothetical protein